MFNNRFYEDNPSRIRHLYIRPPGPHRHPYECGPPPGFDSPSFIPPPSVGPPLPIGKKGFQEIRRFIFLIIISEYKDGITGYQLQEKFNFPRGTLLRTLDDLEEKDFLKIREDVIKGRAQKFYLITEKGKKHLEKLKSKWAIHFSIMSEMAPPEYYIKSFLLERLKRVTLERFDEFKTKEDALDFLRGIRSWMKSIIHRIEKRKTLLEEKKLVMNQIIEETENSKQWNPEELKKLIEGSFGKTN